VAQVIKRFSEDIDFSLAPAFVGIDEAEVERAQSRTRRDQWMAKLEQTCASVVQGEIRPSLETTIQEALGPHESGSWLEAVTDDVSHSPVLLFHYPSATIEGFPYLRRTVKLEFGSLTDQRPTETHSIAPWIAEVLPQAFGDWQCKVVSLDAERTFWEKATILHAEAHRSAADPMPARYSRHYADVAAMARHPVGTRALQLSVLRDRVVEWKSLFFARSWARYDLACPGTFRLLPPEARRDELSADYAAMLPMFIEPPPAFDDVWRELGSLEHAINNPASE
jgi:hypothetical protein